MKPFTEQDLFQDMEEFFKYEPLLGLAAGSEVFNTLQREIDNQYGFIVGGAGKPPTISRMLAPPVIKDNTGFLSDKDVIPFYDKELWRGYCKLVSNITKRDEKL